MKEILDPLMACFENPTLLYLSLLNDWYTTEMDCETEYTVPGLIELALYISILVEYFKNCLHCQ